MGSEMCIRDSSGLFCIAVNPYKRFPIYTSRTVGIYRLKRRNEVPPHIFAIAEGSYHAMSLSQSIFSSFGTNGLTTSLVTYFFFFIFREQKSVHFDHW